MNNPQPWWLTWPVAEVAAVVLQAFSSSLYQDERPAMASIVSYWTTGDYRARNTRTNRFKDPDFRVVAEAIQVLERAGSLMRAIYGDASPDVGLTRLGEHALQTHTVRQHLGFGGAPPTA